MEKDLDDEIDNIDQEFQSIILNKSTKGSKINEQAMQEYGTEPTLINHLQVSDKYMFNNKQFSAVEEEFDDPGDFDADLSQDPILKA